jgi:hypothetical protein
MIKQGIVYYKPPKNMEYYQVMKNLSSTQLSYIAGLFDGEGCVRYSHNVHGKHHNIKYFSVYLSISNTNQNVMDFLKEKIPFVKIYKTNYNPKNKSLYSMELNTKKAILTFLKAILPYLIIKKEKSYEVIKKINSQISLTPINRNAYANLFNNHNKRNLSYIWNVLGMY